VRAGANQAIGKEDIGRQSRATREGAGKGMLGSSMQHFEAERCQVKAKRGQDKG